MMDIRTLPRKTVFCIDMKGFFASCAAVKYGYDPEKVCLAVVSDRSRPGSVVLASSPMMKKRFSIKTGNRLFEIPNHPDIIIVNADMREYLQMSVKLSQLFYRYVPKECIYPYSIDESFLIMDGTKRLWGEAKEAAYRIQNDIKRTYGLPSSVGIGDNMLLAKLSLDLEAKQVGIAHWKYEDVPEKLWPVKPLHKIWGIGKRIERRLHRLGIITVGQLAHTPLVTLKKEFGMIGEQLYYHAHGIDITNIGEQSIVARKGYEKGQILLQDYYNRKEVLCVLLEMAEEIARRAREEHQAAQTIMLTIGYSNHSSFQHAKTLEEPTNITMDIYETCKAIFMKHDNPDQAVRQIHISLSHLSNDDTMQLNLFHPNKEKERKLGYAMDEIRKKYGATSLLRAVSYTKGSTIHERSKLIGGHKA